MNKTLLAALLALATQAAPPLAAAPSGLDPAGQLALAPALARADSSGFAYTRLEHGVQIRVGETVKNVLFHGPDIVRVNANLGRPHLAYPSLVVVQPPGDTRVRVKESDSHLDVSSPSLLVRVDKKTGALAFLRPDGSVITREAPARPGDIREATISDAPTYEVRQTFSLAADESLYGLGQYDRPYMDYRGKEVLMVQTNIGIVVPFLLSTKRYGILWDAASKSTFKDDASGATFWSESSPAGIDYYLIAGETMDGVIAGYRRITGPAPMLPKAAFGFFMSKERYQTQDELVGTVKRFRQDGFPLDYIVQDWQYWGGWNGVEWDGKWSGMTWNKQRFPDPAAAIREIHENNAKVMISIWPSIGNDTDLARELDAKSLRHEPIHWISKKARIYDAFSPEGRAIYFKHIRKGLLDVGIDALWMDGTEVEVGGACHDPRQVETDIKRLGQNHLGDYTRNLNNYSLVTTQGTYEGQRATSDKRVLTLTRSAWAGQQRYSALSWSGDTTASWETFRNQIAGGVNVAMAGQPYWTQDTGGFFIPGHYREGDHTKPEYRELFARWNQFGIFNPIYRVHGADIQREPYRFRETDPEFHASMLSAASLRYRLLPYIYGLAWRSTDRGYTLMRGLPMDFPDDQQARHIDDQFLFGPSLLVHPVTHAIHRVPPPPPEVIPAEALTTADGRPGVSVQYFEGQNFEKPAGKSVDPKVDYSWPGPPLTEPPPGLENCENFSARLTGFLTLPEDGEYEIGAEADDGVRIWLDDRLVVDDWSVHGMRFAGKKLSFKKGQKVAFKIDYFQGQGGRGLRFVWRTPSVLAKPAPVATESDKLVETYLPAGADWYDFWTNARHAGGTTASTPCPLDRFPLFVRAGSIVPMGPVVQHVTEKPDAPYEIRVYPGADATFTLYEDDGETYAYEKGERATVELRWDDESRTLSVGKRQGSFPGLVAEREFRVVLVNDASTAGLAEASAAAVKSVRYTGKALRVKF